ncbi:MAG: T9SS type A sorting domain-containing protein [Calditrichaeota bacterium]|nr:T9SS type A sorting domain-containing protein [Calditrichota bacterium]
MIRKVTLLAIIIFINISFAQWERVSTRYTGTLGKMAIYNGFVYAYGDSVGTTTVFLRSGDQGNTWNDFSAGMPDELFYLHEHNGELMGMFFGSNVGNALMVSADNGESWTTRSSFSIDGGAVLSLHSDGTILYALSNREKIFRSTDNGATWTEFVVSYDGAPQRVGLDFAAIGDIWVYIGLNLGAVISTDGGATWAANNPQFAIGSVSVINGEFYGATYGMYKLDATNQWVLYNNGWPGSAPFWATGKSIASNGQTVFAYAQGLFEASVYQSNDAGNSWSTVATGLPTSGTLGLDDFLVADQHYAYCYYRSLNAAEFGIYRALLSPTAIADDETALPGKFNLAQNYPNPFNPSTTISYQLPNANRVKLSVYDMLGREIQTLVNEQQNAGQHTVQFDAQQLPSGVYFYSIDAGNFQATRKMLLIE